MLLSILRIRAIQMSIVPLVPIGLSKSDISAIIAHGYKLNAIGSVGACIPVEIESGDWAVAVLDPENADIMYGFGRDQCGYFVFDAEGWPLFEGAHQIADAIAVIS